MRPSKLAGVSKSDQIVTQQDTHRQAIYEITWSHGISRYSCPTDSAASP